MAEVCYNRPNRSKRRVFTERDIARITRYAIDDGANALTILKYVIVVSGFGALVCKVAGALSFLSQVRAILQDLSRVLAQMTILNLIIMKFGGRLLKFSAIAQLIIVANSLQELMLSGVDIDGANDLSDIQDAVSFVDDLCDSIGDAQSDLINFLR